MPTTLYQSCSPRYIKAVLGQGVYIIIIIISSLPHGRSLASMFSIYLYLQPFFSFLHNCLPSSRQSYPSLASLLVSFLSFFPLSSALTNCFLVQHVLSSSFSASLLFAPNISLPFSAASTSTFVFLSCQLTFSIL